MYATFTNPSTLVDLPEKEGNMACHEMDNAIDEPSFGCVENPNAPEVDIADDLHDGDCELDLGRLDDHDRPDTGECN